MQNKLRHLTRAVALTWLLCGAATGWATPHTQQLEHSGEAHVGETAPWFALWTSDGAVVNRTSLRDPSRAGTAVVFFATWCEPCVAGMELLRLRQRDLDAAGVQILLINVDDDIAAAEAWLDQHGYRWPWVHDRFSTASTAFGVLRTDGSQTLRLPFTAVVDDVESVCALLGTEGEDYVDVILQSLTD